ncbi:TetR family transcriptional regulator [Streptomyces sp. TRM43335]|uniref:TetR family transcriptional regulator n=1 Tax=Streptomyces taklimakanensis TaxID=2569853 RepID=A0A6G2B8R2_9ACTN|nr:TetR/AcrR family transcriptional regulator [Streptomyces taklimakanensis]MTE18657.1 TetR family transcriptional regulator [Streptomyces taklimakanensis]
MHSVTRWNATRQRLYEAAVTLIAEQGFSATTVDEIAERAGVAKGTVYYNFTSKEGLLEALLLHGAEQLATSLRQAADGAKRRAGDAGDTGGAGGTLDAMLRAGLAFIDRCPAFAKLYVAEVWRTERPWQATLAAVRRRVVAVVEEELRAEAAPGGPDDRVDVPLTASALVGTVLVTALDWKVFQPERTVEEVHRALSALLDGRLTGAGGPA